MAGNVKGITIEFRGDTTKLDKALRQINTETRNLDKELKNVDKALKFNPTNVELWRQKQDLLTKKVSETREKLNLLKDAQAQMDASGVDKSSEEYRKLQREIIETESKVKTFEGQLRQIGNVKLTALSEQFKEVGSILEATGQKMKGLSTIAAGVAAGIGAIAIEAGKAADDLNTLSKVTGISTQDLQKYKAAADLVDVSVEDVAKANMKLKKNMYSASKGSKNMTEAFDALGVSVVDNNGNLRSSDDVFQDVITALGKMENETERDSLAMTLMGKSAANLNPLIEDQGETYKKVADILAKYDLSFPDQETIDKANEFNDELDTMKLLGTVAFQSMASELAAYLAPALEKVVDYVGKFAKWLSNLDPRVLSVVAAVAGLLAVLAPLLITFGKLFNGISAVIKVVSLLSGGVGLLSSGALLPIIAVIGAVVAAGVLLYKNWDTIKTWAGKLKAGIIDAWNAVANFVKSAARGIWDAMTWPYEKAWTTIKSIVQKIKNLFPIDISNFFSKIKLPHISIEGEFSLDPPSVPTISVDWYKRGGIFNSPTIAGLGEAGAEAVIPLDTFWKKLDRIAEATERNGNGEVVINVYASQGMDVNALAAAIEARLVARQKSRNMAWNT